MIRTSFSRKSLAIIIAVAMVFSGVPLLGAPLGGGSGEAYAADGDGSSIVFNYEVDGVITDTVTQSFASLTADTDMTPWKYLAWDGSAYKVYGVTGATDAISIDARRASSTAPYTPLGTTLVSQLSTIWGKTVTYGTVRFKQANGVVKEYSMNDIVRRAQFYTNTGPTAFAASPTFTSEGNGVQAFITLSAKADTVATDSNSVTPATPVPGLTFCTNLDTRNPGNYGSYDTQDERYKALGDMPQNIVEITFVNSTSFNVYNQVGDSARSIAKSYTNTALNGLAKTDRIGFLQSGWTVHATQNYVKIQDLIDDSGLVFNKGDRLLVRSSDMFSYSPSYDTIQAEKYFFGGITSTNVSTANPTEVGAVIAVGSISAGALNAGTAESTLQDLNIPSSSDKRFFIGLSAANAVAGNAAGSRFVNYVTEVTVIKDKADVITAANVTGVEATYKKAAGAITPEVTVTLDGVKLKKDKDYSVTYGTNKELAGAVVVSGKGSVSGTVVKTFEIDDGKKAATIAELEKAKADAIEQAAAQAAAQAGVTSDLQKKLDAANQSVFKLTTPAKNKLKLKAGKKQVTVSWGKIATADQGYQIQYATKKNFSGKKTVKVKNTSTVKTTIKKLKKGKTYYFKVRGVSKVGDKTVYTKWSAAKKIKVKK